MSFDRQRAIEMRAESTRSARRPAFARDWLVSATSCCSEAELNEPAFQPNVGVGATRSPTELTAKAIATPIGARRDRPGARTLHLHVVTGTRGEAVGLHR